MTSRDLSWAEVNRKWRHLNISQLEVAVEGRKLSNFVRLTSYKGVVRRKRQSCHSKWGHVTSGDRKWPWSDVIWAEVNGSGCRPKNGVCCAFECLQGCSSQEEAVTWQEMTSRDLRWAEMTRKWRHLTGSHLEVVAESLKLAYTVRLTSYKAVAHRRGSHVTGNDITWPQVSGSDPEVTWCYRKSPGSGCSRLKTGVCCAFDFLQGWACRRRQWRDRKWRHVTGDRKLPKSDVIWP